MRFKSQQVVKRIFALMKSTKSLLKFQRSIPFENEEWIDRSDINASAFKNYKIPIHLTTLQNF